MRILLYKPVSILLYPSEIRISVYSQTFQQWYNHRFGFGKRLVSKFLKILGIPNFFRLQNFQMLYFKKDNVHAFFQKIQFGLDTKQALFTYLKQRYLIEINTRRGLRMLSGFPCRGQRTRTNASTPRKSSYYYNIKSKSPIVKNDINAGRDGFD